MSKLSRKDFREIAEAIGKTDIPGIHAMAVSSQLIPYLRSTNPAFASGKFLETVREVYEKEAARRIAYEQKMMEKYP